MNQHALLHSKIVYTILRHTCIALSIQQHEMTTLIPNVTDLTLDARRPVLKADKVNSE